MSVELPVCPLVVQGAPVRLQQIVWNLLTNAVKFTPRGGRVTHPRVARGRRGARRGLGHGRRHRRRTSCRTSSTVSGRPTARRRGSTAASASASPSCARSPSCTAAGSCAESEGLGRGARFTFGLPCAVAVEAQGEDEAEAEPTPPLVPVLVVDDSTRDAGAAGDALQAHRATRSMAPARPQRPFGAHTSGAPASSSRTSVCRAWTATRSSPSCAGLPGLEAVPAIALTGHAMDEDRARALAAGFSVHIPKPVDPEELLRVVRRLTA